jgi:nucleoside-diphosphate-sugar epimerase
MKNIWVLGATGYVGRALTLELLRQKERGLWTNYRINTLVHRRIDTHIMERTNCFMGDLATWDTQWWERFPPDLIFHCARMAGATDRARLTAAQRGQRANERLIQTLQHMQLQPAVVYCSGTLMYGPQTEPATEAAPLNPIAYARQYQWAEQPWLKAQQEGVLDVRMARPAWILGADSWFKAFFHGAQPANAGIPYFGTGEQRMSLLHVRDCAGQLIHVATHGSRGLNYNLFTSAPISQKDFSSLVASMAGKEVYQVGQSKLIRQVGSTVAEALVSDIPVQTMHTSWKSGYTSHFETIEAMLQAAMGDLTKV